MATVTNISLSEFESFLDSLPASPIVEAASDAFSAINGGIAFREPSAPEIYKAMHDVFENEIVNYWEPGSINQINLEKLAYSETRKVLSYCSEVFTDDGKNLVAMMPCSDGPGLYIYAMYVAPENRNSGIGTQLMKHALSLSPEGVSLHTHIKNTGAQRFYHRMGFIDLETQGDELFMGTKQGLGGRNVYA